MNLHSLTATLRDNKLFIAMYETEEPHCSGKPYCCEGKRCKWLEWSETKESHKREHEVRESDEKEVKLAVYDGSGLKPFWNEFEEALEKGIDCTFLKDRLSFCVDCTNTICQGECGMCDKMEKMWTLKPIQEEKEEAVEFAEWISINRFEWSGESWTSEKSEWSGCVYGTTKELYKIFKP